MFAVTSPKLSLARRHGILGYLRGYTLGPHQKPLACSKTLFYGAFLKPFYGGGEGGTLRQLLPVPQFAGVSCK
jgi:hypothetical protein